MNKHITSAELAYAPRASVRDWLNNGWRLVPGMEYAPSDYAILMRRSEEPVSIDAVLRGLWRQPTPAVTCREEGCRNINHAYGLCKTHYQRLRRSGHKFSPMPKAILMCGEPGCECSELVAGQGLCNKHYLRLRKKTRRARELLEAA